MTNMPFLRAKIVERQTTQEALADAMKMNRSTFYRKMKGNGRAFTVGEVQSIVELLNLSASEVMKIFFST